MYLLILCLPIYTACIKTFQDQTNKYTTSFFLYNHRIHVYFHMSPCVILRRLSVKRNFLIY